PREQRPTRCVMGPGVKEAETPAPRPAAPEDPLWIDGPVGLERIEAREDVLGLGKEHVADQRFAERDPVPRRAPIVDEDDRVPGVDERLRLVVVAVALVPSGAA